MDIAVEISLYPFATDYIPTIKSFIDRLNNHPGLRVVTNSLSTQIYGPHDEVFDVLRKEFGATFTQRGRDGGKAVFVMKVIGPLDPA